jgi:EmrB/QacA subfamily drug resistance transporter
MTATQTSLDINRPLTVAALLLAMFLAAMEATAVSTAMPTVIGELGGIKLYAWVFTAYMLTSTVSVPVFGKLADLYGRKPVMLIGLLLFLSFSFLCGFSTTIEQLIVFRALQGLGAGAVQTTSLTIVGDLFTLEERAKMQGVFGAVWGLAGICGPLLGGFIVKYWSWQWVFYINIPFGLASAVILLFWFHETIERHRRSLDVAGAVTLVLAVVALLGATGNSRPAPLAAAGVALLALFVWIEKRAPEPLLPIKLFSQRLMVVVSALGALVGATMFCVVTYLPLYVQGVLLGSPTAAGGVLTPMVVAWPIAAALSGRYIPRFGFRRFVVAGAAVAMLAALAMALSVQYRLALPAIYATSAVFGAGLGLINTSLIIAVQTSVSWQERGVATASTMFFRTTGGTLAVGILGGILARVLAGDPEAARAVAAHLLAAHGGSVGQEVQTARHVADTLAAALVPIYWLNWAFTLIGVAVCRFFPRHVASGTSPLPAAEL